MSKTIKSLAAFVSLLAVSGLVLEWATTQESHTGRELLTISAPSIPSLVPTTSTRATFTGGKVSARLCAANANGTCDFMPYAQAIGNMAIPAIFLAPVSLVAFFVFCFGRCCCNCFGGWERTPGNFCYGRVSCGKECYDKDFEGYNNGSIWIVRIFYILMVVALVAVIIPGFVGNGKLGQGITRPGNVVVNFGKDVINKVNVTLQHLAALPYTKDATNQVGSVFDAVQVVLDSGENINKYVKQGDGIRQPIYIVILILAPVVAILGLVGALLGAWKVMFASALLFFWISTLIWLVFGIQYVLLIVFNDACTELKIWDANTNAANATLQINPNAKVPEPPTKSVFEGLIPMTSCSNSTFSDIKKQAQDGIDSAYVMACANLIPICQNATSQTNETYQGQPTCCFNRTAPSCDAAKQVAFQFLCNMVGLYDSGGRSNLTQCKMAVDATDNMYILDVVQGTRIVPGLGIIPDATCTSKNISYCATSCSTQDLRDISNITLYNIGIQRAYLAILYNEVFPLLSCFIFSPLIADLGDVVCNNLVVGMNTMEQVFLALAILLIPTTILAILASKRWRQDSAAGAQESGTATVEMSSHDMSKYAVPYQPNYTTKEDSPPAYGHDDEPDKREPHPIGHSGEPYHADHDDHHHGGEKEPQGYNPAYSPEPERLTPPEHRPPIEHR